MQIIHHGDILENVKDSALIVHGCNARGKMGKGIALSIKQKYHQAYKDYMEMYNVRGLQLGQVIFSNVTNFLFIANAITQDKYWQPGDDKNIIYVDYDAVRSCFERVAKFARQWNLPVHYPAIGAGLGGGDWNIINKIICEVLDGLEHHLWIFK